MNRIIFICYFSTTRKWIYPNSSTISNRFLVGESEANLQNTLTASIGKTCFGMSHISSRHAVVLLFRFCVSTLKIRTHPTSGISRLFVSASLRLTRLSSRRSPYRVERGASRLKAKAEITKLLLLKIADWRALYFNPLRLLCLLPSLLATIS